VIGALLSGTTCESLGHKHPWTTKEFLEITTSHASGEEAIGAIFDRARAKAKRDEDADKGASNCSKKKKRNKKWSEDLLVITTERKGKKTSAEGAQNHFEKLLEGPSPNHAYPVKHLYKDYGLMKKFLSEGAKKGETKKKPEQSMNSVEENHDDGFP
jgi:hypothetical protein